MNTQTKFTQINTCTKHKVHERDGGCCILCGMPVHWSLSNAHIVPRSKGGLGSEENVVTLCQPCHFTLDQTTHRKALMSEVKEYIKQYYDEWSEEKVTYRKGMVHESRFTKD